MWWDTSLIEETVTRQFVCAQLSPENVERLDQTLGFGDGLTDGTYWEWIDEKAKRIFLILLDLGVPEHIFAFIDDSWDDDDLPLALDHIGRLASTHSRDERYARRFYARQFHYLVNYIEKGKHVVYQDDDLVPVCPVDKRPGLTTNNAIDKVELPNKPGEMFSRRRFSIGTGPGMITKENLLNEIHSARNLQNDHLASYYGSYVQQGSAYVIFTHFGECTLKSLLSTSPGPLKSLAKQDRRLMVMNWIHCLTDTLCYIHKRGRSHGNIKPSTILFCSDNYIFYTNISRFGGEACVSPTEKSAFDRESYDFAAPEQWFRPSVHAHRRTMILNHQSSASTWSEDTTFSISRGGSDTSSSSGGSSSVLHTQNPLLDPQAADIFSLGCVILELIGLQMKRGTRAFASHRAAKHKLAGRGGAVLDSSFHQNLGQVESWMTRLAKDASAKKKEDPVFLGVAPVLHVVARMLSALPQDRPTALEVERNMYKILTETCGIAEPHCVHQYGEWDQGRGNLRIQPQNGEDFTIAMKRPGSRLSVHRRSNSQVERDAGGTGGFAGGADHQSHQMMQDVRASRVRSSWQSPPIHT